MPFALVDVFGEASLTGNPLGVVDLTAWEQPVDEEWLREVARELRQSETTFVLPGQEGALRALRSFTAGGVEVTGAGHNALGAWWWLLESGRVARPVPGAGPLVQWIGGRELPVLVREDGALALRQAPARLGAAVEDVAGLAEAVGLSPADIGSHPAPRVVDTGAAHLIVTLTSHAALTRAVVRKAELVGLARSVGAQGVYLAWPEAASTRGAGVAGSGEVTVHTRFFNPGAGLDEDPATGSAAGPLGALLRDHGLLGAGEQLTVSQGASMGRPSTLRVTVGDGLVPEVAGRGVVTIEGRIKAPPAKAG
ncbi:PhzF family phenazine biosynthesis protein [Streptomyces sp. NBC_01317]|nr:PhzF family phenazine biosynthesis protein [Streptomyces sp. NBC_01317]